MNDATPQSVAATPESTALAVHQAAAVQPAPELRGAALWTIKDVAAFLRISERKLWYGLRTAETAPGSVPHVRYGRMPRFIPDDVKLWAAQGFPPAATFKLWKEADERRKKRAG